MSRRDHYDDDDSPYGTTERKGIISSFRGEYAFLSNFYNAPFDCSGRVVPTAEHAFQAQKTWSKLHREQIVAADGPRHAKYLGRKAPMKSNWDEIKVGVMRRILAYKFAAGSELAEKLVATHPSELVEGNTWNDTFWGCVRTPPKGNTWVGANWLGRLLMERRAELMRG